MKKTVKAILGLVLLKLLIDVDVLFCCNKVIDTDDDGGAGFLLLALFI